MHITKIIISLCIIALSFTEVIGQDHLTSQYDANPLTFNPSLTGMFEYGEIRAAVQHRTQWPTVTDNLNISTYAIDMPFKDRYGLGIYIKSEEESELSNYHIVTSGAGEITLPNQNKHRLTVGLQFGLIYKSTKRLTTHTNYDPNTGSFNEFADNGERLDFHSKVLPEINYGFSYVRTDFEAKVNPYGGFAMMHATNPIEALTPNDYSRLGRRFVLHGGTKISVHEKATIDPALVVNWQSGHNYITYGLKGNYDLNSEFTFIGGIHHRIQDAIIPQLGLEYKTFIFRMSYDITTGPLGNYNYRKGGFEFSLIYISSGLMNEKPQMLY